MLGACRLTSLATSMPQKLAGRTGVLSEDEPVRRSFLLHTSRSVRRVVDSDVEHEAKAASAPSVALASVLSESMTAVDIAHLPCRVSWPPGTGCASRR